MGNLILPSLEIRNFRGFRHLQIERLGRVNLIVGKNNIGKTSLLEALSLYTHIGSPTLVWETFQGRDEVARKDIYRRTYGIPARSFRTTLNHLFYGRKDVSPLTEPIQIGPKNIPEDTLLLSMKWFVNKVNEDGEDKLYLLSSEEYNTAENPRLRFTIQMGAHRRSYAMDRGTISETEILNLNCMSIDASGLDTALISELWDRIVLRKPEEDVLAALRIIAPGVERLSFSSDTILEDSRLARSHNHTIPIVKLADTDEPIPLRSLGDGMQRILGIALALVNAKDGMLLVDEIENGLHYSVLPDLWRLIFQVAHRLNIQVFATTHSWDCIEAFQKAAVEDSHEEALLMRLDSKKEGIGATLFDERKLTIATREQIEVR